MQTIKGLVVVALLAFSSAFFIESVTPLSVEKVEAKICPPGEYVSHGDDGLSAGDCSSADNSKDPQGYVKDKLVEKIVKIYNPIAMTLLAISILMIIYAAYKMMSAAGEPQKIYMAKRLLMGSGIGIVVILSSFTIMRLVMTLVGATS